MKLPFHLAGLLHLVVVTAGLLAYVLATRAGRQHRHPSAAIGWVLGLIAFPYVTLPLFLLLGARKLRPLASLPRPTAVRLQDSPVPAWSQRLSAGLGMPPPRRAEGLRVIEDGAVALAQLRALIDHAQADLVLCTYVFADDATGRDVAEALCAAARRGVRVRVLIDAVGSRTTSKALRRQLRASGVELRAFMPLLHAPRSGRSNWRNHRKLVVADASRLWSGGRNLADEYFVDRPGRVAWQDLSYVVGGALAADAREVFENDWRLTQASATVSRPPQPPPQPPPKPPPKPPSVPEVDAATQLLASGPDHADDVLHAYLGQAIAEASVRICIATPYFVPDDTLTQLLWVACRRGVQVRLLLPARSNHRLADWARGRPLRRLAQAGASVALLPGMLHAKLVLVDDTLALCGSANFDARSLFLNFELMTAFHARTDVAMFARWFDRAASGAHAMSPQAPGLVRDIGEGLVRAVAFQL